ncbi:Fasciclin-2 [Eumeta japonica]|uniref:Fasciclin-2 n=1 Tax=Eumeta variegata TaxID=151549 RepID=A0A4C1Y3Y5_EUMVA|nr:Fasciclin-2 [Eumeta japonica]
MTERRPLETHYPGKTRKGPGAAVICSTIDMAHSVVLNLITKSDNRSIPIIRLSSSLYKCGLSPLTRFTESKTCLSTEYSTRTVTVQLNAPLFVQCTCNGDAAKLKYLKWAGPDNQFIPEAGPGTDINIYAERTDDSLNLLIKNFTEGMSGMYQCSANYDNAYFVNMFELKTYPPLRFVNTETKQYLIKGHESKINCEVGSDANFLYLWHRQSKRYVQISDNDKYKIENNGLSISNVQEDDAGDYVCSVVVLDTGDTNNINITVEVISMPDITELEVTPNKTIVAGDFLKIECKGSGQPTPNYNWTKIVDEKPTPIQEDSNYIGPYQENNTLTFASARHEDEGTYRCTASNMGGMVTKQVTIQVLEAPEVVSFNNVTAVEGARAEIACRVRGKPLPRVNLMFDKIGLDADTRISQLTNQISETEMSFSLIFSQVDRSHHGLYMCQAVNDVDNANETALLNVLFKPVFEKPLETIWGWKGQIVNLTCFYESNPEGNVTWSYHGENTLFKSASHFPHEPVAQVILGEVPFYGDYTCTVMNEVGASTKVIYLKEAHPPGLLMNVVFTSKSATSVVFDIVGPTEVDGPPILEYTAEYDEAQNFNTTDDRHRITWDVYGTHKVDKLKPNTTYLFRFAGVNQVGIGSWSSLLELRTEEKSPPEEPLWEENITDLYDSVNSLILSWKKPESNGDPIDHYEIEYCETEVDDDVLQRCMRDRTYENKIMLQNLKANTTYHIMLYAHNSVGNSPAAEKFIRTSDIATKQWLSASNIIGISVLVVVVCLVLVDLMLCCWKDQGVIANVCCRKRKQKQNAKEKALAIRDKKGLLSDGETPTAAARPAGNGHKEFVYEKNTGAITGKHSVV